MNLNQKWKSLRNESNTENVLMSISDVISYYKRGRININPSYQRQFVWSNEQKTKYIESILLKYPVPPIITVKTENEHGLYTYEIIDGLQRLSTIFEFVGAISPSNIPIDNKTEKLDVLAGASQFTQINGKKWSDFIAEDFDFIFESSSILFLNLTTGLDDIKYEMFERLNTLSTELSAQEVRNSIIAMKDPNSHKETYFQITREVSAISEQFLSDKYLARSDDMEFFVEFSLIKRYEQYIERISERISLMGRLNKKATSRHFDMLITSYIKLVSIDELASDLDDYKDFLQLNSNLNFRKYDLTTNTTVGNPVKFFFEILAFAFFKKRSVVTSNFYQINFNENYNDIMKHKIGKNNPNARLRFDAAQDIINKKDFSDDYKLF